MANEEHLAILGQGVPTWNDWRYTDVGMADVSEADLSGANLSGADLTGANFRETSLYEANLSGASLRDADFCDALLHGANLEGAYLPGARFSRANLSEADLRGASLDSAQLDSARLNRARLNGAHLYEANLRGAILPGARLRNADLRRASLAGAILRKADLRGAEFERADLGEADLREADVRTAILVETRLWGARLSGAKIYALSAWSLDLRFVKEQSNLRITNDDEPLVTVDNLEVAQFVHLLLHNEKIRGVIDTIGNKGVLILGRFTPDRKEALDAIRERLRQLGYVPMIFDFDRPTQQDFAGTIRTLTGMSRFVIADITNPRSSPLELQATVPDYMVPFVPIIQETEEPFGMFADLQRKYGGDGGWVLDVLKYDTPENLIRVLEPAIVKPALVKADQLLLRKAEAIRKRHVRQYG